MKIVLDWLQDFVALRKGVGVDDIVQGLIGLGHEVESVEDQGRHFAHVVVGRVLARKTHPNADKLGVCTVDVGEKTPRTIVCGAPNAREGITVAVALPGAVLPGDFRIASTDKRGVVSDGMICSVRELGLGDEHEGIWEMDTKAAAGTPLVEVVKPLVVLDVAVTPNRGDCLSHYGIARDLAALGLGTMKPLDQGRAGKAKATKQVATETEKCPYISAIEITGVDGAHASPAWMQQRLLAVGVKPRNLLVDSTNYVMLALGQPLHAYDLAKVDKGITASEVKGGLKRSGGGGTEVFGGLDGGEYRLEEGDIVIRDGGEVVGLGGVLGGAGSAVSDTTTAVLLEGACFDRVQVSTTGQRLGLSTDARSRFERGVDPAMTARAVVMCANLMAGEKGTVSTLMEAGAVPKAGGAIEYDPTFFEAFIGLAVDEARQRQILEALGFAVKVGKKGWLVVPPSWRTYMETPEDLTEEVLRVVGYEKVVPVLPVVRPGQFAVDGSAVEMDRRARKALALAGMTEVMNYSFIGDADALLAQPDTAAWVVLDNPLVETMTVMRPSLLPGLLRALTGNMARKESTGMLGEVGKVFDKKGERMMAAGLVAGPAARHWHVDVPPADVFRAKGLGEAVLETLNAPVGSARVASEGAGPMYHPGKSGVWQVGPFVLGRFGELHPKVLKALEIDVPVAVFELDLEVLLKLRNKPKPYRASPYPPVQRDVALVVGRAVTAEALRNVALKASKELVRSAEVFDVYVGKGVPEGRKSVALGLVLQADDRTLKQEEIDAVVATLVDEAAATLGAVLRA